MLIDLRRGWVVKADEAKAFALVGCAVDKHLGVMLISICFFKFEFVFVFVYIFSFTLVARSINTWPTWF